MRNRKNVLVLALLSGLGISAASAEQPDALKGLKSAVSMQQSTPQQTSPPDAVASTDTPAARPAPTTATLPHSVTVNTGCRLYTLTRMGKHPGTADILTLDLKTRTGLLSVHRPTVTDRGKS